jgi:hypothetical protein
MTTFLRFSALTYNNLKHVHGVGQQTAGHISQLLYRPQIISHNHLVSVLQSYNRNKNTRIRYNFIKDNKIKMKSGEEYTVIFK